MRCVTTTGAKQPNYDLTKTIKRTNYPSHCTVIKNKLPILLYHQSNCYRLETCKYLRDSHSLNGSSKLLQWLKNKTLYFGAWIKEIPYSDTNVWCKVFGNFTYLQRPWLLALNIPIVIFEATYLAISLFPLWKVLCKEQPSYWLNITEQNKTDKNRVESALLS